MSASTKIAQWPRVYLTAIFVAWKALIFLLAACSPGPGYDTSTTLLYPLKSNWSMRFIRWDGIYFTQSAQRGHLFEQEWAFSWSLARVMHFCANYLRAAHLTDKVFAEAWAGIAISHVAHLVAVQALYSLALKLFSSSSRARNIAFTAAVLHVLSPAGIFLSAPYAESLFAALQFLGYNAYAGAWISKGSALTSQAPQLLFAGSCFGLAMLFRSNGLFSGILFAYDAVLLGLRILTGRGSLSTLAQLVITVIAGICIVAGAAFPQIVAYREYCVVDSPQHTVRPWCLRRIPSIYLFVQDHYWNNGLFKYWTLSNVPLFLLAAPTMWVLARSCYWGWSEATTKKAKKSNEKEKSILPLLAVIQGVLFLMMLLQSHVQIVTRVASGYPLWYLWLAATIQDRSGKQWTGLVTRWMVMYAMIQGALFASFLPPA